MQLVSNISEWKKWWSMRFIIITTIFSSVTAAYVMLPADWLPEIPIGIKQFLAAGSLISAAIWSREVSEVPGQDLLRAVRVAVQFQSRRKVDARALAAEAVPQLLV